MRTPEEQRKALTALCGYLELAKLPHGVIREKYGERGILSLPVSRGRDVVYCDEDGGYDIWKKHPIAVDLTAEGVVEYLRK